MRMSWYHDIYDIVFENLSRNKIFIHIRLLNNIWVLQGNLIVTNAFTSKIWIGPVLNDAICKKCGYLFLDCIFANYVATPNSLNHEKKL